MRRMMIIVIFFLCVSGAFAQEGYHYFYGTITDQSTQKPVVGVNISFKGSKTGCVTDRQGNFSFFIDTIPVYMVVSHLGYETKKIWLDGTFPKIMIRLTPASIELNEVEIVAKAGPVAFYQDELYSVLDYQLDFPRIYILVYRFGSAESEIICKRMDGEDIGSSGRLLFKPDSLFTDCLGNVHVMGHDSCYQMYVDSTGVHLMYSVGIERFRSILKDCIASTETKLFFKKVTENGFGVDFYRVDRETSVKEKVTTVVDEATLRRLKQNEDDYYRVMSNEIPEGNEEMREWSFAKKIMYRPRTASMYRIGKDICVFNTADMTIEFYTVDGDFTGKVKMECVKPGEGRWTKEFFIDEVRQRAYTSFIRGGTVTMFRVDLGTGELVSSSVLKHIFPQRIKVSDGKAYYLYNVPGEVDNKKLFRQGLKLL
ncbi:MAG TPA: carboxypeptidase-like regulatory domain-containing protein [Bacteroidales bacterium]|nr:carboxypeptidase-like regulatory domain-containing protein [Bacteroidales bacterium]HPS74074.1 carboxypeptidase-like regulatory domain-containing protein [Bacteroidales bacterium]